jgi:anti-anti-sigma factor
MSPYLSFSAEPGADHVLVRLRGELDIVSGDGLRAALEGLLDAGPMPLVVDLSGLSFADCGGMSVLLELRTRLAAHGCAVTVTGPQPIVSRLLRLTGMDTLFRLGEDEHHGSRNRTQR